MPVDWGYEEHNGPSQWLKDFPTACGKRQSPIDIKTGNTERDTELEKKPLKWVHVPGNCTNLLNTGNGWKVEVNSEGSSLSGGPLQSTYQLLQFHCHWGRNNNCGSEHTVDGKNYCGEIHLVHWNSGKYETVAQALEASDGLAVLGAFFELGQPHAELDKLVYQTAKICHKGHTCTLNNDIDPSKFLPENHSYWTYEGSLTTPPCSECVTWIVFKNSITVSEEQLSFFRELLSFCEDGTCPPGMFCGKTAENFRPPQPLENRVVREVNFD